VVHPKIVDPDPEAGFSGRTYLDFADPLHGWAIFKVSRSVAVSFGVMLRTENGGKSWTAISQPPIADHFRFVTAQDGWLAGGPDLALYVTHDGGESWKLAEVKPVGRLDANSGYSYDLPSFADSRHGFLAVTASGLMSPKASVVLFSTEDAGRSWKPSATLRGLPNTTYVYPTAICDSEIITAAVVDGTQVTLFSAEAGGRVSSTTSTSGPDASGVQHLSFADSSHGWILSSFRLLSTSDGGSRWSEVTPGLRERSQAPPLKVMPRLAAVPARLKTKANLTATPASGNVVSTHLGFDAFPTPTTAVMKSWWQSSPFYDAFIYLYGSPNKSADKSKYPTKSWLSTVQGYGWGVIPIWFGLQSSCIINQPNVTHYFGPTASDASTQGAQEADQAIAAAQLLGITGTIIYHDIENYTVNSSCSPVVQAFVDGWDSEIHLKGYIAGIYANPGPIKSDISNSQNITIPDEIWITKTPGKGSAPQVTTWNQGFSDTLWPNHQRKHQFLIDQANVTFGGATLPFTDEDIDDALAGNPIGSKSYSFNFSTFDYPGATTTTANGINDINSSGSGQVGQIVGYHYLQSDSSEFGFQDNAGVFTSINFPGAVLTASLGINDSGWNVGWYKTSGNSPTYPAYLDKAGTFISLIPPGSVLTGNLLASGVNDAGMVVGSYVDSSSNEHSFLYNANTNQFSTDYYSLTPHSINGTGRVVGNNGTTSLLYSNGSYTPIAFPGAESTIALGINNNGQIVGYYYVLLSNLFHSFLYDLNSGVYTSFDYPGAPVNATFASGINDLRQIVGQEQVHGFLSSPP
jgi:photosystem II stability/assembly factor-like uncharacterized protein